ncbi:MAG: 30S ribosomal protein S9 [Verrucomicrobiales bacterium]
MSETNDSLGTGRRKTSVARVRLASGTGKVTINGRSLENYFPLETQRNDVLLPLNLTDMFGKLDVRVNVCGGGSTGQAGAVRHGISRALLNVDANLRPILKLPSPIDCPNLLKCSLGFKVDREGGWSRF